MTPVAFYAPLKSPNHPSPSGDRAMARGLLKALRLAGFAPQLMSELRTLDPAGDPDAQAAIRRASAAEAERIIAEYRGRDPGERPRLWFTYHVHYKAPDWIGPAVSEALGIPYVVAEGSRASKRANGPHALGHRGAEAALDRADAILVLTDADRETLERARPPGQRLVDFPPFLDLDGWPPAQDRAHHDGPARLLAVGMMRPGDKLASYRLLAQALRKVEHLPWTLEVIGDGEARAAVVESFSPLSERVSFRGAVEDRPSLAQAYAAADLLVWPAVNEAYGMALLEAQAYGCPVLAGAYGGVASVVRDGATGRLVPPGDAGAFAGAVVEMLADPAALRRLSTGAAAFVRGERTVRQAAERLKAAIADLLATVAPA